MGSRTTLCRVLSARSGPAEAARLVTALLLGSLAAVGLGVVLAGPASAIDDPTQPSARLTHGPNCVDGFVRVAVTAGTETRTVTLVYDGSERLGSARLEREQSTELAGYEVDHGEQVAVSVASADGTGAETTIPVGDYTRPSQADCDAVTAPTSSAPPPSTTAPSTPSSPAPAPTTPEPTPSTPAPPPPTTPAPPSPPAPPPRSTPAPPPPTTVPSTTATPPPPAPAELPPPAASASSVQVAPGGVVTLRGAGFRPGESVTVRIAGARDALATVTAGGDGSVEAVVQIPRDAGLGPATVQLVGVDSAVTAGIELQVAARELTSSGTTPLPLVVAGVSLLAAAVGLAAAAVRRPARTRR